jgi:hypothetical protein
MWNRSLVSGSVPLGCSGQRGGKIKPGNRAVHYQPHLKGRQEWRPNKEAALRVVTQTVRHYFAPTPSHVFDRAKYVSNMLESSACGRRRSA